MDINQIGNDRLRVRKADAFIEIWFDNMLFSVNIDEFSKVIKLFQEAERVFGIVPKKPEIQTLTRQYDSISGSGGHNGN
jgi:hypothetical protein